MRWARQGSSAIAAIAWSAQAVPAPEAQNRLVSGPSASIALVNPLEELSALAPLATWREAELFAGSTTAREHFLKHLTENCQAVVDARVLVMDYANPLINHAVELLAVDEAAARSKAERLKLDELQPLLLGIRDLEASFAEGRTRPIGDLVTDVNRYEALVQALCGRFGIDVDQFIREAAELRIAGAFENEQARTARVGAMKLQSEADTGHDVQ